METIKKFMKDNQIYLVEFFGLLVITLALSMVFYSKDNYSIHVIGNTTFGTVSWLVVIITSMYTFFMLKNKNLEAHKIYLILIIPIGLLYCLANPLGKVSDEEIHARKAMAIAQGNFWSPVDDEGVAKDMFNAKLNELVTSTVTSYEEAFNRAFMAETDAEVELGYNIMALYSPICHAPQAFGMFITRLFKAPVTIQCYAGRLCNFALAVFLIYEAIKIIPKKKSILLFISLLPMTVTQIASLSSDALLFGTSIFFVSYILYLKESIDRELTKKELIIIAVTSIVLALSKIVYLPICFFVFLIPKERFPSKKAKIIILTTIIIVSVILNVIWLGYCSRYIEKCRDGASSSEQIAYCLSHPISLIMIIIRTVHMYFNSWIEGMFGGGLANYTAQVNPVFIYMALLLFTILVFSGNKDDGEVVDVKTKVVSGIICFVTSMLIFVSIYIQWNNLGNQYIGGIQGRYFIPLLILYAYLFDNRLITFNTRIDNRYVGLFLNFYNLSALCAIMFTLFESIVEYYV